MKKISGFLVGLCMISIFISLPLTSFFLKSASAQVRILKVGTSLPLSGPAAEWGLGQVRLMEFFAEDVNKAGGLKIGKDTYEIKIIAYDNKSQPSEAAANATKLVEQDKIQYLISGAIAATGMAILPITQPAKVVTTSQWWGKKILGPDKPFSFRQTISQLEIAPAMYTWIAKNNPK